MDWEVLSQVAEKLLENGGPLGTLVICVGMFVLQIWRKSVDDVAAEIRRNDSMERMANAFHTVQLETLDRVERMHDRTVDALDRNTEAFGRTAAALDKVLKTRNRQPRESRNSATFAPVSVPRAEEPQEPPA